MKSRIVRCLTSCVLHKLWQDVLSVTHIYVNCYIVLARLASFEGAVQKEAGSGHERKAAMQLINYSEGNRGGYTVYRKPGEGLGPSI